MTPLRIAVAVVRTWTRIYTARVQPNVRETRRAEIESDLWEFQQDQDAGGSLAAAIHVLVRLMMGIPDDLGWRADHSAAHPSQLRRTVALSATAAALALAALWVFTSLQPVELPPTRPPQRFVTLAPPPPPPPPPPPLPPSMRLRNSASVQRRSDHASELRPTPK